MKYLIDTHIFLWYLAGDPRISRRARKFLGDTDSRNFFLSDATAWEAAIKYGLGKLRLPERPEVFFPDRVRQADYRHLHIALDHVARVHSLPPIHRDPFDRLLIVQAMAEDMTIVSSDPVFEKYSVKVLTLTNISQ